jgi:phosphoribosylformylglycinamidine synthase PurS subunit
VGVIDVFEARIYVTLKKGILDPQGKAVKGGLDSMGYQGVADVRVGKFLVLTLGSPDRRQAEQSVREMCDRLLANPVIEDYTFEVQEVSS